MDFREKKSVLLSRVVEYPMFKIMIQMIILLQPWSFRQNHLNSLEGMSASRTKETRN